MEGHLKKKLPLRNQPTTMSNCLLFVSCSNCDVCFLAMIDHDDDDDDDDDESGDYDDAGQRMVMGLALRLRHHKS